MYNFFHKTLAEGRWFTFSLCEQMGNIGSEVGRALNWHKNGEKERQDKAIDRALELFDLTLQDPRWKKTPCRLKEISRAREIFGDFFFDNEYQSTPENLEKYFYWFAVAARKNV